MFSRPGTLDEALQALSHTHGTILSCGTDLFPALPSGLQKGPVIDISAISELKGVHCTHDYFRIGGRTTWSELLVAPLPRGFDGLRAAAREIGSVQVQNQATVAGNICNASPAADGVAALLALDAEVTLASRKASRSIPLADFVQGNRRTVRQPDVRRDASASTVVQPNVSIETLFYTRQEKVTMHFFLVGTIFKGDVLSRANLFV